MSTLYPDVPLAAPVSASKIAQLINGYARRIFSLAAIIPVFFLLNVRFEPTSQDTGDIPSGEQHV